jgi:hypothetical protein
MQHNSADVRVVAVGQALENLRWAVDQGQPSGQARHALADHYAEAIDDLEEATRALAAQLRAAGGAEGWRAARPLAAAQRAYARLIRLALERAIGFEQFAALDDLAREIPAWEAWVAGVIDGLEPLSAALAGPLEALAEALERQPAPGSTLIVAARPIDGERPGPAVEQ